jgi:hypothetical protein
MTVIRASTPVTATSIVTAVGQPIKGPPLTVAAIILVGAASSCRVITRVVVVVVALLVVVVTIASILLLFVRGGTIFLATTFRLFILFVVRFATALSGGTERPRHGQGILRARLDGNQARLDRLFLRLGLVVGRPFRCTFSRCCCCDKGLNRVRHLRNDGGRQKVHFHARQLLHHVLHRLLVGDHGATVLQDVVDVVFLNGLSEQQGPELALQRRCLVRRQLAGEGNLLPFFLLVVAGVAIVVGVVLIRHDGTKQGLLVVLVLACACVRVASLARSTNVLLLTACPLVLVVTAMGVACGRRRSYE